MQDETPTRTSPSASSQGREWIRWRQRFWGFLFLAGAAVGLHYAIYNTADGAIRSPKAGLQAQAAPLPKAAQPAPEKRPDGRDKPTLQPESKPAAPAQAAPAESKSPVQETGYGVQMLATSSRRQAQERVQRYEAMGLPAGMDVLRKKTGEIYRVRVGWFATQAQAVKARDALRQSREHPGSIIKKSAPAPKPAKAAAPAKPAQPERAQKKKVYDPVAEQLAREMPKGSKQ